MPQAHGAVEVEPTFDVEHVAESILFMANLPAGRQRAVHDHNGHQDALHRTRLAAKQAVCDGIERRPSARPHCHFERSEAESRNLRHSVTAPAPRRVATRRRREPRLTLV